MYALANKITQSKVQFLSSVEALHEHIDPSQIPQWLGGTNNNPLNDFDESNSRMRGGEERAWTNRFLRAAKEKQQNAKRSRQEGDTTLFTLPDGTT